MNHASDIGAIEQRLAGPYPPLALVSDLRPSISVILCEWLRCRKYQEDRMDESGCGVVDGIATVCFNPRQGKACHVMRKPNT